MPDTTTRARHERRLAALKTERNQIDHRYQELNDYISPGRYRPEETRPQKGKNPYAKIIDNTALRAHRIARSGMQAGLTSPSRPWMRYGTEDEEMKEFGPVKDYLYLTTRKARSFLSVSNIYNCLHTGYGDELLFGQFCMILSVTDKRRFHGILPVAGQYWLAQSQSNTKIDTCYRRVWMTVEQVVGRFVANPHNRDMDWSKASTTVKNLWDKNNYDEWVEVYHAIEPRKDRDPRNPTKAHKAFMSNYWEADGSKEVMLEISGFDRDPIIAPRWDVIGEDVYSAQCPGMEALPDVKMLQKEQAWKGTGIEHQVKPSLVAPTSLRNARNSSLPGSITFVDELSPTASYRRAFDVNLPLSDLGADIETINGRINSAMFADLFMAITNMEGIQPKNVFELTQRKEEQLQQLGPTVERQHHELIMPLADWVYYALDDMDELPPPPKELEGEDLRVENISTLQQAQLAVSSGSLERMMAFAGQVVGANPDSGDKIDFDQAIDEYGDAIGVMPTVIRSDDDVASIRQRRQQQQQAAQAAEMAAAVAPAIKDAATAAATLSTAGQNGGPVDLLSRLGIAG